jgi:hypothetical protein
MRSPDLRSSEATLGVFPQGTRLETVEVLAQVVEEAKLLVFSKRLLDGRDYLPFLVVGGDLTVGAEADFVIG